ASGRGPARLPRRHGDRLLRDRSPGERLLAPPAVGLLRPGAARGRTPPARAPPAARCGGTRPRSATLHRPALPGTLARPPAPLSRHARQLRDHAAARLGLATLRGRRRPRLPRDPGRRTGRPLRPRRGRGLARVPRALPGGGRRRTRSDVLPPRPPAVARRAARERRLPPGPVVPPPRGAPERPPVARRRPERLARPLPRRRARARGLGRRAPPGAPVHEPRPPPDPPASPGRTARTRTGNSPGGLHRLRRAAGARRPARCRRAAPGCARLPLRPPSAPVPGLPAPPGGDRTGRVAGRAVPAAARGAG